MTKKTTTFFLLLAIAFAEIKAQTPEIQLKKLSDAPNDSFLHKPDNSKQVSYLAALQQWKTVSDVNDWIKNNFD